VDELEVLGILVEAIGSSGAIELRLDELGLICRDPAPAVAVCCASMRAPTEPYSGSLGARAVTYPC